MKYPIFSRFLTICVIALAAVGGAFAQYKGSPVKKEKLVSVLRSKQLQTREIVSVIKTNGVDFQVSQNVELELYQAGARPEVIAAAKANYRFSGPAPSPASGGRSNFSGSPLTKDAVVTLLQNGVADAQIRKNVSARGVNFKPTTKELVELKKSGASTPLINLIVASYANPNQNSAGRNDTGRTGPEPVSYQNLLEKAVELYDTKKDVGGAIAALQQAVRIDPSEARAYQQLGFVYLYGQKNFDEAEKSMRNAIDRGGSAVFRVFHDHDGLFTNTCQGSLFIAKDGVRFEGDDNKHTFQTADTNIKQLKMNSMLTTFYKTKAGSFKIVLKSGDDSVKFNFAPLTDNALESKMIIRLIGK
jgi:Tetratricopeptide repeat